MIGLTFAVEGFNIIGPWAEEAGWGPIPSVGVATLKAGHIPGKYMLTFCTITNTQLRLILPFNFRQGDLNFDPLGLLPKTAEGKTAMKTKELNNGRLAMLGIAGIVAQELITNQPIFNF